MIYEFECARGHVTEASVPVGTKAWPCEACIAELNAINARSKGRGGKPFQHGITAKRILSPTRTTFVFADTNRRG